MEIIAEVTMLDEAQGGRKAKKLFPGYRPHIVINPNELLGVSFKDMPEHIPADTPIVVSFNLLYLGFVDYSAIVSGAEFKIVEGARVVGLGRVIST